MTHTVTFTKATGAGNDFVIVDNMQKTLQADKSKLSVAVCSRHYGVGADGLLVLEPSTISDFAMLYYNADGTYGGMCGNGGRCAAQYAFLRGIAGKTPRFEALGYVYEAEIEGGPVRLKMKNPTSFRSDIVVDTGAEKLRGQFINTGSPHVVFFMKDIESLDVKRLGRRIREHEAFAPEGTNVNFVRLGEGDAIHVRTYERGVENETLACGTGSVASAVLSGIVENRSSPVSVHVRSGEVLQVSFERSGRSSMRPWRVSFSATA